MPTNLINHKKLKPVLLCILDGFGIGDENNPHNAIAQANTPNYDRFLKSYPHSRLETSGLAVGLPEGQIGNSEVGHMSIGAGRVVFQDLPKINNAILDGSFEKNLDLQNLISDLKKSNKACHLVGLLSDGGVHSHINHIVYLSEVLEKNNIKTHIHAFLDGRDVAQKSALNFIDKKIINKISTISGRYFAMDRDNKWDRIKKSYDAIINGAESSFANANLAIEDSYKKDITDEFIEPCAIANYSGINDGDALIFCNFRADRARQLSNALLNPSFKEFETKRINFSHSLALTKYSDELNKFYKILFPNNKIQNSLPEILAKNNLTQLRIAETEKYAHVTFFFSCGVENEMPGEERILVKSPNVATYDLQPEMSASEVGDNLKEAIRSQKFDFIVVNYANSDMVGHSGKLEPAIKACETIDEQLGILEKEILAQNGAMLISADHGNIECMVDENHKPHTSHTTNLVPLIFVTNETNNIKLDDGALKDIAPTILNLLNIKKPEEMTGNNLIIRKN